MYLCLLGHRDLQLQPDAACVILRRSSQRTGGVYRRRQVAASNQGAHAGMSDITAGRIR